MNVNRCFCTPLLFIGSQWKLDSYYNFTTKILLLLPFYSHLNSYSWDVQLFDICVHRHMFACPALSLGNTTVHQMAHFLPFRPLPVFLDFTSTLSHLCELGVLSSLYTLESWHVKRKRVLLVCANSRFLFWAKFNSHLGLGMLKALLNAYVFVSMDLHR